MSQRERSTVDPSEALLSQALSRRGLLKSIGALGVGLPLMGLGLSACSSSSGGSGKKVTSMTAVLSFTPDPSALSDVFAVNDMKSDHGITVHQKTLTGANTVLDALIAGQIDIAASNISSGLAAVASGQKITAVFPGETALSHMYVTNDKIQSWSDLPGKTFGITSKTDSSYTELAQIVAKHDIDINDIKFVSVSGTSARASALIAGKIDGGSLTIGAGVQLLDKQKDLHQFALSGAELRDTLSNAYWVKTSALDQFGPAIQAYAQSMMKQYRALGDKATYLSEAKSYLKGAYTDAQLDNIYTICTGIDLWDPNTKQWNEQTASESANGLFKLKVVKKDLPFDQWGTAKYVDAARSSLGSSQ